jgi:hypothetical protein
VNVSWLAYHQVASKGEGEMEWAINKGQGLEERRAGQDVIYPWVMHICRKLMLASRDKELMETYE